MDLGDAPLDERQVPVLRRDARFDAGDVLREPVGMPDRHEAVLLRRASGGRACESTPARNPRAREDDVVVEPALVAAARFPPSSARAGLRKRALLHLLRRRAEQGLPGLAERGRGRSEQLLAIAAQGCRCDCSSFDRPRRTRSTFFSSHARNEVEPLCVRTARPMRAPPTAATSHREVARAAASAWGAAARKFPRRSSARSSSVSQIATMSRTQSTTFRPWSRDDAP